MNSGFIASVQRALAARGFYQAPITGVMDEATTAAVRLYQRQQTGVDSPLLSVDAAKVLGLVALTPTDLGM
jgi:peptidoglycan hydrolase-like protein with peptidoglycan-binding domain